MAIVNIIATHWAVQPEDQPRLAAELATSPTRPKGSPAAQRPRR